MMIKNKRERAREENKKDGVCIQINQTSGSLLPLERRQQISLFYLIRLIHTQTHRDKKKHTQQNYIQI